MNKVDLTELEFYRYLVEQYIQGRYTLVTAKMSHPMLNNTGRKLLCTRMYLKKSNWKEALSTLSEIATHFNVYFTSEVHLLRASALALGERHEEAYIENIKALDGFNRLDFKDRIFLANYNLSVDAQSLGLTKLSTKYLNDSKIWAKSPRELALVERALAFDHLAKGEPTKARSYIEGALRQSDQLSPVDKKTQLTVAGDIFFRLGDIPRAKHNLEKLRLSKSNREAARVHLELMLLNVFENKALSFSKMPICVAEHPVVRNEWKLIELLYLGDIDMAKNLWTQLMVDCPKFFGARFQALSLWESRGLFYQVIFKLLRRRRAPDHRSVSSPKSKLDHLNFILSRSSHPVSKTCLIKTIWNRNYCSSLDSRFYKLMERLRKSKKLNIQSDCTGYWISSDLTA